MYGFTTRSGSSYTVENGRISRLGDDIENRPGAIVNAPMIVQGLPVKGERFRFRLKTDREWITTSPVVMLVGGNLLDRFAEDNVNRLVAHMKG